MKDLHLKYKMDTGTPHEDGFARKTLLSEEYIEWLEDLAEKYLKQNLSRFSNESLANEIQRRRLKAAMAELRAERNSKNIAQ